MLYVVLHTVYSKSIQNLFVQTCDHTRVEVHDVIKYTQKHRVC